MTYYYGRGKPAVVLGHRYRVGDLIARGGMSNLHSGVDLRTGQRVAIKLMRFPDFGNEEKLKRFRHEIDAAGRLEHPNIVRLLDSGETRERNPFLVMELLQGRSLQAELENRGRLSPSRALEWILPLIGALAHAHDRGIVHRDIKPANIFLSRDPSGKVVPKLLDFGISVVSGATRVTRTGVVVGTVQYMAPEQICDAEVGPATDIWSIGAVLYRCLAGTVPFEARNTASLLLKIVNEPAPFLVLRAEEVGAKLAASVDRALRKDPARRYPDMRFFARALCASARDDGVPLPVEPDLIGLAEWRQWCEDDAVGDTCETFVRKGRAPQRTDSEYAPTSPPCRPGHLPPSIEEALRKRLAEIGEPPPEARSYLRDLFSPMSPGLIGSTPESRTTGDKSLETIANLMVHFLANTSH